MEEYIDGVMVRTIDREKYSDFSVWLKVNGYKTKEDIYEDSIINGMSEEEVEDSITKLEDEFLDWCTENEINGEI